MSNIDSSSKKLTLSNLNLNPKDYKITPKCLKLNLRGLNRFPDSKIDSQRFKIMPKFEDLWYKKINWYGPISVSIGQKIDA